MQYTRCDKKITVIFKFRVFWRLCYEQVQLWYNRFKEDQEDVNDDARPGRLNTTTTDENIEAVKKMILDNRRITTTIKVADDVGLSFGSWQAIFTYFLGYEPRDGEDCSKIAKFFSQA